MFSANFEHMFDFNYTDKTLRIIKTEDQAVLLEVPEDVITLNDGENDTDSIREVYAKAYFNRESLINIENDKTQRRIQWHFKEGSNTEIEF